jgi:hypothetical protein
MPRLLAGFQAELRENHSPGPEKATANGGRLPSSSYFFLHSGAAFIAAFASAAVL